MFKKSIPIIFVGLSVVVAMLVLGWVVFVKIDEPVQAPVVDDGDGKVISDDLSNNDISGVDISDWKTYRNEEFGFEIKYPEDWDNKNSESVILFSENGPIGSRFGFCATEKNVYGNPFWVSVYCIPNIKNIKELEYFDFAHRGDVVYYDDYNIVKVGHEEGFFEIKEKSGHFTAYIKIRDDNYFQISYHNPEIDSLRSETEQILSTFKFIDKDDISDWNIYQNELYGYEIKYPKDWVVETYEGKYGKDVKKSQEKADWIQLALHRKDKQKIEKYQESMIANISIFVINKESSGFTVEDYLKDFGYDLNSETVRDGHILLTRGIAKVWMNIKEEYFKGHRSYVIQTKEEHGYYLYFEYDQNIYKITSLWNTDEINKKEILEIINTFKFTE